MSLATPLKLRRLQEALYTKAKQDPVYRFYLLYDKVYRADILAHAYALAKQNGGAPGMDGRRAGEPGHATRSLRTTSTSTPGRSSGRRSSA